MISIQVFAQEEEEKTAEKVKKDWVFYEIKVGANLIRAGRTFFGTNLTTQEIQATLGVNGVDINIDYGREENVINSDYRYINKGSYFRIGIDRNFVKKRSSGNALSLGLRYANATFEDELDFSFDALNEPGNPQNISLSNTNLKSRWLELVFNLRGKITSNLYTGFSLRWQFANTVKGQGPLKTFNIPGFGNTKRDNSTAFDYYVMWRIPLKK